MLFMDGWIRRLGCSKTVISTQLVVLLQGFPPLYKKLRRTGENLVGVVEKS